MLAVFRPITANAKLSMNPRSDVNFSSPKVDLVVNLREVAVELNRPQVRRERGHERESEKGLHFLRAKEHIWPKNTVKLIRICIVTSTMCIIRRGGII